MWYPKVEHHNKGPVSGILIQEPSNVIGRLPWSSVGDGPEISLLGKLTSMFLAFTMLSHAKSRICE